MYFYFFGCAVITPHWTCAWFLHLAKFPALFRGFIPLKVSPKPGWVHSPNHLVTAEYRTHHSKLQELWEWILSVGWQKHLQIHKQDSLLMIQTYFSQSSWKTKGRAPNRMDQALPSNNPHNNCKSIWIRFFTPACNVQNNVSQQLPQFFAVAKKNKHLKILTEQLSLSSTETTALFIQKRWPSSNLVQGLEMNGNLTSL